MEEITPTHHSNFSYKATESNYCTITIKLPKKQAMLTYGAAGLLNMKPEKYVQKAIQDANKNAEKKIEV